MRSVIDQLAARAFDELARRFPVCMASDEFHFFPQARHSAGGWEAWDDFSESAVADAGRRLGEWVREIDRLREGGLPSAARVESRMLQRVLRTLAEQLTRVAPQRCQPTFHLTVLSIGLAEALEAGPAETCDRLRGAAGFVERARTVLGRVPAVFRDLGRDMIRRQLGWLPSLDADLSRTDPLAAALGRLDQDLASRPAADGFRLEAKLYERVARDHMGCGRTPDEIAREIDRELQAATTALETETARVAPGLDWRAAVESLPVPVPPPGGTARAYRRVISRLADHCREIGLVSAGRIAACPVRVLEIPDPMLPVRSNAAFSMPPVHPPAGGTFHILPGAGQSLPVDYRLLTAHETWPGHHLLDTRRWNQPGRVRRHIEFPIFYEGWASFAEELLFDTGFFTAPADRLLLARRRYWRAVRGRIDLEIHTGRRNLDQASERLATWGMAPEAALRMVKRYALKPGYQLAYTMGRRRFRRLYQRFTKSRPDPAAFARRVLAQGEPGFDDLAKILQQEGDPQ